MTLEKAKDKQQNSTVALRCIIYVTKLWNCISFKHISVTLERNYSVYWVYKPPVFQFPLSGLWSTEAQIIKPPMWISITLNVVLDEVTGINAKVHFWQTSNTLCFSSVKQLWPYKLSKMAKLKSEHLVHMCSHTLVTVPLQLCAHVWIRKSI